MTKNNAVRLSGAPLLFIETLLYVSLYLCDPDSAPSLHSGRFLRLRKQQVSILKLISFRDDLKHPAHRPILELVFPRLGIDKVETRLGKKDQCMPTVPAATKGLLMTFKITLYFIFIP